MQLDLRGVLLESRPLGPQLMIQPESGLRLLGVEFMVSGARTAGLAEDLNSLPWRDKFLGHMGKHGD